MKWFGVVLVLGLGGCAGDEDFQFDGEAASLERQAPKITICHYPPGNPANVQTITISENAWPFPHEALHGDTLGPCEEPGDTGEPPPPVDTGEPPPPGDTDEPPPPLGGGSGAEPPSPF